LGLGIKAVPSTRWFSRRRSSTPTHEEAAVRRVDGEKGRRGEGEKGRREGVTPRRELEGRRSALRSHLIRERV